MTRVGFAHLDSRDILHSHRLVEEILDGHRDRARWDDAGYAGYKGHVHRVLNFARVLVPDDTEYRDDKLTQTRIDEGPVEQRRAVVGWPDGTHRTPHRRR